MVNKLSAYFVIIATICFMMGAELYAQTRIRFASGKSSATVTGTIPAKSNKFYVVGARSGQVANVTVSPSNLYIFSDAAPKGEAGSSSFETDRGNNEFGIYNPTNRTINFTMTISIH